MRGSAVIRIERILELIQLGLHLGGQLLGNDQRGDVPGGGADAVDNVLDDLAVINDSSDVSGKAVIHHDHHNI